MSCKKIRIYYYGDGVNTKSSAKTRQGVEKKATISLPKKVIAYGEENGFADIDVTSYRDSLILKGGGEVLMETDINGGSNEYIEELIRYEWLDEDGYVVDDSSSSYTSDDDDSSYDDSDYDDSDSDDSSSAMSASEKIAAVMQVVDAIKASTPEPEPKPKRISLQELMNQPFKVTLLGILLCYPEYRFISWVLYVILALVVIDLIMRL